MARRCKFLLVLKSKVRRLHCGGFQTLTVVCVTFRVPVLLMDSFENEALENEDRSTKYPNL